MQAPIAFQSSEGHFRFEGVAQLINAFAEKRGPDAKAPLSVVPSDGIIELVDEPTGPCRGMIFMEDLDCIYSIHSSSAWKITWNTATETATAIRIGTIPGTDQVQLSRNQNTAPHVVVKTDAAVLVITSDSVQYITDTDLPADIVSADYVSGYTVVGRENRIFNISGIDDSFTWDVLDFATFQQRAGKLVLVAEHAGELVGFNSSWTEFWRDTGAADFPFTPIGFKSRGLRAPHAVVRCDNTLMFPGDDGIVYKLVNYDPSRISTHTVERIIQDDLSSSDMLGFSWTHDGHSFASWTGTDWTRCYDAATGVWHTRSSYGYDIWRGKHTVAAWNKVVIGDQQSGMLGYLDRDTFTEFGDPMIWGVDSPPLHVFPNGGIIDALHLDLATGYGLLSGQGSDPKIMLEVSKDGGSTYSQYRELELGITGKYATRVTARRLGKFGPKGVVFRLRISDPVVRCLVGTDIELRPLKR